MGKSRLKHVFPGGNTSVGFHSYYNYLIAPDATRIFVIKGGPGVGKSTLMRKIGEEILERGYDVEYHHCSSDNGSLDGVVIPAISVALLDGTAPHVVDPQIPGAVAEIIHLGDFWNEDKIRNFKNDIIATNRRLSRLFTIAYSQLAEAMVIRNEMESYVTESMQFPQVNALTAALIDELFGLVAGQYVTEPKSRHLFYSAISPGGVVHYIDSLLHDVERLHLIKGRPGSGRSRLVEAVAQAAQTRGLHTENYHCTLEPQRIDLVVIPEIQTAVLKDVEEMNFNPGCWPDLQMTVHDLDTCLNLKILSQYLEELGGAQKRFTAALQRAIRYIGEAKATHDRLESFYIPAMDFTAIESKRDEILRRILDYAAAAENGSQNQV